MSMESLSRFPSCIVCDQGVDENDATRPYTIVKGEHVHLGCSEVTELSAAFAKEVHDYLTIGVNATRSLKFRDTLLDEEETEELVGAYLMGTPAIEFAKRLEARDISDFERNSDPCPDRAWPNAENE